MRVALRCRLRIRPLRNYTFSAYNRCQRHCLVQRRPPLALQTVLQTLPSKELVVLFCHLLQCALLRLSLDGPSEVDHLFVKSEFAPRVFLSLPSERLRASQRRRRFEINVLLEQRKQGWEKLRWRSVLQQFFRSIFCYCNLCGDHWLHLRVLKQKYYFSIPNFNWRSSIWRRSYSLRRPGHYLQHVSDFSRRLSRYNNIAPSNLILQITPRFQSQRAILRELFLRLVNIFRGFRCLLAFWSIMDCFWCDSLLLLRHDAWLLQMKLVFDWIRLTV